MKNKPWLITNQSLKLQTVIILITLLSCIFLLNPYLINYTVLQSTDLTNYSIPKASDPEISIVTPENITYIEPMSGFYPALYGFENDDDETDPVEWDVFEGAGFVNVKDSLLGHSKIIEMYDGTGANHDELHKSFQLQTSGSVEFWVLSDDVAQTLSMRLLDSTATGVWGEGIGWIQIYNNYIRYQDDIGWTNVKTISDNTWYHIKIEFECTTGNYQGLAQDTWRFYVDGQIYGDFNFLNDINNVTQLYCFTRGADNNYRCYADAFGFSWNPNYDIGDNLAEGLLLSFDSTVALDWIGYSLDGATNKTIIGNRTIPMPIDGKHNIQVFGNDSMNTYYKSDVGHFTVNTQLIGEIIIGTPENKTYYKPMSGFYPALYGFENDDDGTDPAEWDVFEGAGFVNVKDSLLGHSKIIEMYDGTGANHDELHKSFQLQTSGSVEFWVLSDDVAQTFSMTLLDSTATGVWGDSIGWIQIYNNQIRYQDDTGWTDVKTINDNTWYHIKIEFECTTGNYQSLAQDTWRFYVDGQVYGDFNFLNDINNVTQLYCFTRGADNNYRCYTDAFGFSWNPNYDIGDNLVEGLLLSFDNTATLDWIGYSLDGATNKTIIGNKTIPMPSDGEHSIQVFGNNSIGNISESIIRYFTINTQFIGEISIVNPENITYIEPMSGFYPALYGFENDDNGADPGEWDVFEGAGFVNVKDSLFEHSKIVEMYDGTSSNHDELHKSFQFQTSGTVEFWVLSDDVAQTFSMTLLDSTATGVWGDGIGWIQIYNNYIRYQDDTGWTDVKTINDNTWYHIKIEFECTTDNYQGLAQDTWRFYVDGQVYGDFNFLNDINNVTQLYCFTRGADNNYRCYTDAFGFSWNPDYEVGDNLVEGLLLSFDNTVTSDWIGYSLDGATNKTILGNRTIPMPSDGRHKIQVFSNDSIGRVINSSIRYFTTNAFAPTITINSPELTDLYGVSAPNFSIEIPDSDLSSTYYSLDGGITKIMFSGLTGTVDQTEWEKIGNGSVTLTFYANDSVNHIGISNVSFRKDIIAPNITIISPSSNDLFGLSAPDFNIQITDLNLNSTWYSLDLGTTKIMFSGLTGTIDQTEWEKLGNGTVILTFYANDSVNNVGFGNVTFRLDIDGPKITIIEPSYLEEFETAPQYNITIEDFNLYEYWYTIDNGLKNYSIIELAGEINSTMWNSAPTGPITLMFYAKDSLGNVGTNFVTILKIGLEEPPPEIPGYNLFYFIGIGMLLTGLAIRKRFNNS